jgi:two-component system LytT family response regulator
VIPFRVLVVDDEPLAREMVVNLLKTDREIESVVECGDARQTPEIIARQRPHIVFLDVEMPEADGIQVARTLDENDPIVVFITAFSHYATQAFDVRAVDYVLKPFSDQRFFEALARAKRRVRERHLGGLVSQIATLSAEMNPDSHAVLKEAAGGPYLERLSFRSGDHSIVLKTAEVIWIEAEDYYVLIHSKRGRHMVRATLSSLEQRLDPRAFLRVHRAALVNLQEVQEIREDAGLSLVLSDGSQVAVSRSRRERVDSILRPRFRR